MPDFAHSVTAWARVAFKVRSRLEAAITATQNLGIPTWHYGHEPPNPFATSVAKYFQNSVREATLLKHCAGGIVFLPGAAGTVQEIFQDACENYYSERSTLAPMVLVGDHYWTDVTPAWPLLESMAQGRAMHQAIHLVDDIDEAVTRLTTLGD